MTTIQNKRILVTGGTGFIGSHLVEALIAMGNTVVTTFQTYNPFSYFSTQKLDKKTIMNRIDVSNFNDVLHLITKNDITHIFHLGSISCQFY